MAGIVPVVDYESYAAAESGDATIAALRAPIERAVTRYLGYNPVQKSREEFYPRGSKPGQLSGSSSGGNWETQGGRAVFFGGGGGRAADHLQMQHLPVRGIPAVYEDLTGQFGSVSGSFGPSTQLTYGSDFWMAIKQTDGDSSLFCSDGILIRSGSWSIEPGTVKVVYTAGYSAEELNYDLDNPPSSDIDASPIALACKTMMLKVYKTRTAHKSDRMGSPSGIVTMERAGDYMYQLDVLSAREIAGFTTHIPAEVAEMLHEFRNYNLLVAG